MADITVLLPIYNESDNYITEALESIINQSFKKFKVFITLDNPENERLSRLIDKYVKKDDRISFWINEKNLGLPVTLNRMIDRVDTKYIARMDADDISQVDRLKIQYEYMEQHPEVDLCGTNIIYINENGKELHRKGSLPTKQKTITQTLKFISVLCHPTFFIKTSVLKNMKYRNLKYAQDYDLLCRLVEKKYKITNINQYLLWYRSIELSDRKRLEQKVIANTIAKLYKKGLLSSSNIEELVVPSIGKISEKQIEEYAVACREYESAVICLKNKRAVAAVNFLVKSFFRSKFQRNSMIKAVKYKVIMYFDNNADDRLVISDE